jgi:hypothetical protein
LPICDASRLLGSERDVKSLTELNAAVRGNASYMTMARNGGAMVQRNWAEVIPDRFLDTAVSLDEMTDDDVGAPIASTPLIAPAIGDVPPS